MIWVTDSLSEASPEMLSCGHPESLLDTYVSNTVKYFYYEPLPKKQAWTFSVKVLNQQFRNFLYLWHFRDGGVDFGVFWSCGDKGTLCRGLFFNLLRRPRRHFFRLDGIFGGKAATKGHSKVSFFLCSLTLQFEFHETGLPGRTKQKQGAILENQRKWKIQAESTIATECPLQSENGASNKNSTAKAPSFNFFAYSQFSENTPPASTSLGNEHEICSDFQIKSCENMWPSGQPGDRQNKRTWTCTCPRRIVQKKTRNKSKFGFFWYPWKFSVNRSAIFRILRSP